MSKRPVLEKRMLIVEPRIQIPILIYSFSISALSAGLTLSAETFWSHMPFLVDVGWPNSVMFAIVLIVIIVLTIIVGIVVTNKIAGPFYSLHQHIKRVADGAPADPLVTRADDFINRELVEDYNRLLKRLKEHP